MGLFESVVIFFGIMNSPATFCKDLSAKCLKVPLNVRVDKENL